MTGFVPPLFMTGTIGVAHSEYWTGSMVPALGLVTFSPSEHTVLVWLYER